VDLIPDPRHLVHRPPANPVHKKPPKCGREGPQGGSDPKKRSDAPCTDPDPIQWIHRAVNHSNPSERITVQQALRMATYNGAWTTFDEKERGSLEAGKVADMVILSDNPYTVDNDKIRDIKGEQLILAGKPYESAVTPLAKTIWNGIFTRNKY
jgi:hypothetical protein